MIEVTSTNSAISGSRVSSTFSARNSPTPRWRRDSRPDQAGGVPAATQGQCRQLQAAAHPSVDAVNASMSLSRQLQATHIVEERSRLVDVETQCFGIDFDQLVADPQSAHGQSGPRPAGHDDLQVVASVLEQETERGRGPGSDTRCQSSTTSAIRSSFSWISSMSEVST